MLIIKNYKKILFLWFSIPAYAFCSASGIFDNKERYVRIVAYYEKKELGGDGSYLYRDVISSGVMIDENYVLASAHALYKRNDAKEDREHRSICAIRADHIDVQYSDHITGDDCSFRSTEFMVPSEWEDEARSYPDCVNYDFALIRIPKKPPFLSHYYIADVSNNEIGFDDGKLNVTAHGYEEGESPQKQSSIERRIFSERIINAVSSYKARIAQFFPTKDIPFSRVIAESETDALEVQNSKQLHSDILVSKTGKCAPYPDNKLPNVIVMNTVVTPGMSGGPVDYVKNDKRTILGIIARQYREDTRGSFNWNAAVRINEDVQNKLCYMKDVSVWSQLEVVPNSVYGTWVNTAHVPVILIAQGRCVKEVKEWYDSVLGLYKCLEGFDRFFDMCIGSDACVDFVQNEFGHLISGSMNPNFQFLQIINDVVIHNNDQNKNEFSPINMATYDPLKHFLVNNQVRMPVIILNLGMSDNSKRNHGFLINYLCEIQNCIYIRPNIYSDVDSAENQEIIKILQENFLLGKTENSEVEEVISPAGVTYNPSDKAVIELLSDKAQESTITASTQDN